MDERIMKALETLGGRIVDLELDVTEAQDENRKLADDYTRLTADLEDANKSKMFWYKEHEKLESESKAIKSQRDMMAEVIGMVEISLKTCAKPCESDDTSLTAWRACVQSVIDYIGKKCRANKAEQATPEAE